MSEEKIEVTGKINNPKAYIEGKKRFYTSELEKFQRKYKLATDNLEIIQSSILKIRGALAAYDDLLANLQNEVNGDG